MVFELNSDARAFINNPTQYVLQVQENSVTFRSKGLWTWLLIWTGWISKESIQFSKVVEYARSTDSIFKKNLELSKAFDHKIDIWNTRHSKNEFKLLNPAPNTFEFDGFHNEIASATNVHELETAVKTILTEKKLNDLFSAFTARIEGGKQKVKLESSSFLRNQIKPNGLPDLNDIASCFAYESKEQAEIELRKAVAIGRDVNLTFSKGENGTDDITVWLSRKK